MNGLARVNALMPSKLATVLAQKKRMDKPKRSRPMHATVEECIADCCKHNIKTWSDLKDVDKRPVRVPADPAVYYGRRGLWPKERSDELYAKLFGRPSAILYQPQRSQRERKRKRTPDEQVEDSIAQFEAVFGMAHVHRLTGAHTARGITEASAQAVLSGTQLSSAPLATRFVVKDGRYDIVAARDIEQHAKLAFGEYVRATHWPRGPQPGAHTDTAGMCCLPAALMRPETRTGPLTRTYKPRRADHAAAHVAQWIKEPAPGEVPNAYFCESPYW